jgi:hypothetical protein
VVTPDVAVSTASISLDGITFDTDTVTSFAIPVSVPEVTTLPATPYDGQIVDLLVDSAGTYGGPFLYRCKYRAATAGAYKWQVIGPPILNAEVLTGQAVTSAGWANAATVGPDITVPFAGNWEYGFEMWCTNGVATFVDVYPGLSIGGAAPVAADYNLASMPATLNYKVWISRSRVLPGLAAGTLLRVQYGSNPSQSITYTNRRLWARPLRLG